MINVIIHEDTVVVTIQGGDPQTVKLEDVAEVQVTLCEDHVSLISHRPEIFFGAGSPPDVSNLANGSLFFRY
jgi:hypothetical protein